MSVYRHRKQRQRDLPWMGNIECLTVPSHRVCLRRSIGFSVHIFKVVLSECLSPCRLWVYSYTCGCLRGSQAVYGAQCGCLRGSLRDPTWVFDGFSGCLGCQCACSRCLCECYSPGRLWNFLCRCSADCTLHTFLSPVLRSSPPVTSRSLACWAPPPASSARAHTSQTQRSGWAGQLHGSCAGWTTTPPWRSSLRSRHLPSECGTCCSAPQMV